MQQVAHGFWALFRWHSVIMSAFVWQLVADVPGHWPPYHLLDIHNPPDVLRRSLLIDSRLNDIKQYSA